MVGRAPGDVFERGLQPQRTALSWRRTGNALVLSGVLLLTRPELGLGTVRLLVAGFALALGAVFQWAAFSDTRLRAADRHEDRWVRPTRVRAVLAGTALVQLFSLLAVLTAGR